MPVKFILGPAGTGKTKFCFDHIAESIRKAPLGPPIFWFLPRQATFIAERQLACAGGGRGYFRARILDFENFATEVLAECGGVSRPQISDRGRRMILGHILRQSQERLRFFKSVATQPGVAAQLDATFAELQRAGLDPADISGQVLGTSSGEKPSPQPSPGVPGEGARRGIIGSPALRAKLHDLALIGAEYAKFLGQDRIDPQRRLAESLESISRCTSLRDADVYVDSFYEFTSAERQTLAALAKVCRSMVVTLTLDPQNPCVANPHLNPDEMDVFNQMELTWKRLYFAMQKEGVEIQPPLILSEPKRFQHPEIAHIERAFRSTAPAPAASLSNPPAIDLVHAPDYAAEVDAAARWIRDRVAAGMRYRDIVVLMRSQDDYHHLIESSFGEHEIPFFADRRRTASHHPLIRLIRSLLGVALTNWSHDAMMATIKTSLVGLGPSQADALENYVLRHGIDHTVWVTTNPWTGRRSRGEESDLAPLEEARAMDALRRPLVDGLRPFVAAVKDSKATVQSIAAALFKVLEDFQVRTAIVGWIEQANTAGRLEEAGEHERVWDEVVKLFDELVDLFPSEPISLADFSAVIDAALEGFDLALTPPTVDQVLVGAVDRTRTPPVKACVVLGVAEGQFPRACAENSIFTDVDRRALHHSRIDLDPDTARRLLDENFLGYIALTRASERLLLTRISADETGRTINPSTIFQRVRDEFPALKEDSAPRSAELALESLSTPRQLVGSLMRWFRAGAADARWEPVYQWLAHLEAGEEPLAVARFQAWRSLSHCNDTALSPERAAALFPSPLRASARQLESFRMCPFQHFARYGLGLSQRQERRADAADLSRIFHEALSQLVRELIDSSRGWSDLDDAQTKAQIARLIAQIGAGLRDSLMLSSARNRYLLAHVERTLALVAAAQKTAGERGHFKPAAAAIGFGERPTDAMPPLAITTPAGKELIISGKIDRIDALPDGSASIIDYRLFSRAMDASETYHGLCLQLLICLLALEKHGKHLTAGGQLTPAAAFCVQLSRPVERGNPEDTPGPDDPAFHLRCKPRGIFNLRITKELDSALSTGSSDVVSLFIKQDGGIGRSESSDAAEPEQFGALLRHIEKRIGEMVDEITAGRIDIRPYRHGRTTPCPRCEFRSLCRLEPSPGCYDDIEPISRAEMLQRVSQTGGSR